MFCSKCGAVIEENAKFCSKCGAPVNGAARTAGKVSQTSPDKKTALKPVVIGLAILAAAVVGVGGYFLFRGDQSGNSTEEGVFNQSGQESGSLHQPDEDEYPVHIYVYSAAEVRTGADGGLLRDLLAGARVSLRSGAGARTGEVLKTLEAGADGTINTTLPAGTYTAQIDVDSYVSAYVTVEVSEEISTEGYVLPLPQEGQAGIVLTWEGEADLDLTLFTPYQSADGDMARIGGRFFDDDHGNRLVADNGAGCEVMYANTDESGSYKLYVSNYTETEAGNYVSSQMSALNIHIYIYDSTGMITEYTFPEGQTGVVWEVADISGGQVTPSQRVYSSLEGESWWMTNKWVLNLEENIHLYHLMESMALAAWGNNDYDWSGFSKNTVNGMQAWADRLYQGNWEMLGDWMATVALTYYSYPKFGDWVDIPYIEDIMTQPEVVKVLQELPGGGWLLTKEQLEYLSYAASGHKWEMQSIDEVMNAHAVCPAGESSTERLGDSVLFVEGIAGSMIWLQLENVSTEYTGGGSWSVTADCIYIDDYDWIPLLQFADITFTVTRNFDSCFDRYSITGMSVTPTDNSSWAKAYYDYLVNNWAAEGDSEAFFFFNLDGDGIPEIFRVSLYTAYGTSIIHYSQGEAKEDYIDALHDAQYIEGTGLFYGNTSRMDHFSDTVYLLVDGELKILQQGSGEYTFDDFLNEVEYNHQWNGNAVTEEEYNMRLNEAFDNSASRNIEWEWSCDINLALNALQNIISNS